MDLYVPSPCPQRTETTVAMSAGRPTPGCAGRGEDPGGRSKVRMEILTSAHGIPSWSLAEDQAKPVPAGARRGRSGSRSPHPECPSAPVFTGSLVLTPQGLFQWPSPAVPSRGPPRDAVTPPFACKACGTLSNGLIGPLQGQMVQKRGGSSGRQCPARPRWASRPHGQTGGLGLCVCTRGSRLLPREGRGLGK